MKVSGVYTRISTWKICDTCKQDFRAYTATTCDECKERIYQKKHKENKKSVCCSTTLKRVYDGTNLIGYTCSQCGKECFNYISESSQAGAMSNNPKLIKRKLTEEEKKQIANQKAKLWYKNNKKRALCNRKKYYLKNKEKMNAQSIQWRQKNRERWLQILRKAVKKSYWKHQQKKKVR